LDQIADEAAFKAKQVRVGQDAWIPCFPARLESNPAGWPILRRGSIASHPLAPTKAQKTFLLDYSAFGGDSGAPVVVLTDVKRGQGKEQRPLVVGLVFGMNRQTDKATLPFEERIMHTPLALAVVVHAPFIRETIDL